MKKLLIIFIAILFMLVSCQDNFSEIVKDTESGFTEIEQEETTTDYRAVYLPAADYGGYEFRLVNVPSEISRMHTTFIIAEETGDLVNDAIYRRNRIIEEKYTIIFRQTEVSGYEALTSAFQKSVNSNSDDFDLGQMAGGLTGAFTEVQTGRAVLPKDLPYLDVSQPWYIQGVNEQFTIAGKMFLAYSDECLNLLEQTQCVLFNKKISSDFGFESLYDLVINNKWTVDRFFDMAKAAADDLNGDGAMTDTDRFGIVSTHDFFYPNFWTSAGIKPIERDSDGLLVFIKNAEKLYSILDKVYENVHVGSKIFFETHTDKAPSYSGLDAYSVARHMFANNQGLFYPSGLGSVQELRGMDTDFGILPFPKYDEAQEKYYTNGWDGWIYCVPVTNPGLERTSIIMEALAVESKNLVIDAFKETALRTKYARDNESLQMLDIIEQSRTMDFSIGIVSQVRMSLVNDGLAKGNNNFASSIEKNMNQIERRLTDLNEAALAIN
ncbi:MAG: hypothetical protein FWF15_00635 [Oscillospiraceae bacterium]|nr:hypothetical protein [Oscillospiraceae bacterium]